MGRVCITVPDTCDVCYSMELATASSFNIPAGLTPGAEYYLWIRDKFDHLYRDQVVINGDGSFDIASANYPDAFFTSYAGGFIVFMTTDDTGHDVVPMNLSMAMWNCLILDIAPCS